MQALFGRFPFAVVYLDDLCIFSKSPSEHAEHLKMILDILRTEQLYAQKDKCSFGCESIDFLGHTVSSRGLSLLSLSGGLRRPMSSSLQSFLGLAGYYRRFIYGFFC